nr:helix-turn-helix domain-containing protein [uncultured Glaciecola sp.]
MDSYDSMGDMDEIANENELLKNSSELISYQILDSSKFDDLKNTPQVCTSYCFECPLSLYEVKLSANVSITRSKIKIGTRQIPLNEAKFRTLCAFKRYEGVILSRAYLLKYTWGEYSKLENNVNVMVSALRTLLSGTGLEIVTIRNQGYIMTQIRT